ncbi:MAG TPA: hypothetical protein VH598_11080, partial [Verrucomicrobiae bacterium]|nr:hypothetical protein [Verrucomicrobiae bacterium]
MTPKSAFSEYAARLREFIRLSMLPPDGRPQNRSVRDAFDDLARELFALQFKHNAPYRVFCEAQKITPPKIAHWPEVPAMPAVGFKEFDLTSLPLDERARVFYSSGTTGQIPSRHFHDAESLSVYEASLLPWFRANVSDGPLLPSRKMITRRFIMLTPSGAQALHSSLVHMFEIIAREFALDDSTYTGYTEGNGDWSLDRNKTITLLTEAVAADRPVLLMGTAFNFVHLLDFIAQNKRPIKLPAGSRILETGGYKGRSRVLPKAELH